MKIMCLALASLSFTFLSGAAYAEDIDLLLDLPVIDLPFNATDNAFQFPSERQSLALSTDFYQGVHHLIAPTAEPSLLRSLGISAFDVFTLTFPLSNTWLHEEWHRAVLGHRNIKSFNDTYNFPIGRGSVSVSHVSDEDLVRLKRDFPADQVRLSSAGIEAQYEQNLLLEKRRFFQRTKSWDKPVLLFNHVNNILYLATCADGASADGETRQFNEEEGADVARRDFTGLDCTAWVYDLFRPREPYAARGTHPSGVGLNRYRTYSDLSEPEKDFLRLQRNLSFLNLVDPFLFGFDEFESSFLGFGQSWNATLRHHLTSFGYSLEANLFIRNDEQNWLFQLHNGVNSVRYFPGVSLALERYPIRALATLPFRLSAQAQVWTQPEAQDVRSTVSELGGLLGATAYVPLATHAETYVGVEAKSQGWVAGNVYLERNVSVFGGLSFLF